MQRVALIFGILTGVAMTLGAQPSLPPDKPPKNERPEVEFRRADDGRKESAAKQAASTRKSSSSSSKSRTAEIRAMAFSDDALRTRPLIIKDGKMDSKIREQLKEDLLVMCRILEKAAREHISENHKVAGIDLLALGGGNRSVRTMYLDDYGVLFTLNVRMPLLSDAKAEEPEALEPARNEEWEETRNELFGQKRRIKKVHSGHGPAYNEQDVEELKNELIDAVKNASNIRNLQPDDWITVAVTGPGMFQGNVIHVEPGHGDEVEKMGIPRMEFFNLDQMQGAGESTMVLRVRKGQLDEAVKKDGNPEEMRAALEKAISLQVY